MGNKTVRFFLTCCLVFVILLSIAGMISAAGKKLTVWSILEPNENLEFNRIAKEYTRKTGVEVEIIAQNQFTTKENFMADAPAGKGPEIIMSMHTDTGTYAISEMIRPLMITDTMKKSYYDLAFNSFIYGGKTYGIGYSVESYGLVYNKKLVKKAPETWEEMFTMAEKLTVRDKKKRITTYGFLVDPKNFYFTFPFFSAYGGYVFGRDEQGNFNTDDIGLANEGSVKALTKIMELVNKGLIPRDVDDNIINDLFENGQLAMMIYGPWYFRNYRASGVDLGYEPIPRVKDGNPTRPFGTILGFMLSSFSKQPQEAEKFLDYLLQDEIQQRLIESYEGQRVPLNKSVSQSDFFQKNPFLKNTLDVNYQAEPYPNIPEGAILWDVIPFTMDLLLNGDLSVEKTLIELEMVMRENIKAMRE